MARRKPSWKSREIMSREMAILRCPVELFIVCYAINIRDELEFIAKSIGVKRHWE